MNIVNDEFFVIDSDNLESIESHLYGYYIIDGRVTDGHGDVDFSKIPSGEGSYVFIKKENGTITIMQDYIGSYGIYAFCDENYFAFSNSFPILVDHVKKDHKISFNKEYADYLLVAGLCSVALYETMINEISMLDRTIQIEINTVDRKFEYKWHDYNENTVPIDTEEGMRILDRWYDKWSHIISRLKDKTSNIQMDLSGGLDSRMIFNLFLGSGIDLNEIYVHSINDGLHTHDEDFAISSEIANAYGFSLNDKKNLDVTGKNPSLNEIMTFSFIVKLGFHKQMYYKPLIFSKNRYCFTGSGGECIRDYWKQTTREYIEKQKKATKKYGSFQESLNNSIEHVLSRSFGEIREKYERKGVTVNDSDLTMYLYRETRCRNHFGKNLVENYLVGEINFCPLLDPELYKLKVADGRFDDKNLLMTIMFLRFNEELLNYRIEGNRSISQETISYAREICRKYPLKDVDYSRKNPNKVMEMLQYNTNNSIEDSTLRPEIMNRADNRAKEIFLSNRTRKSFAILYNEEIYNTVKKGTEKGKFFPLQNAYAVISISKYFQDVLANEQIDTVGVESFIDSQLKYGQCDEDYPKHDNTNNKPQHGKSITGRIKKKIKKLLRR